MGTIRKSEERKINVPKFVDHLSELEFEEEGNHTLFEDKGRNGNLKVKINI